jgi:hypothetical protein
LLGLTVAAAGGCSKARAETVPDGPPLATPAPPPRVLAPVEVLVEAAPVPDVPPAPAPTVAKPPAPRRPATPPAADTQKPAEAPAQPPQTAAAEPQVRQPASNPAEEKRITEVIQRAFSTLSSRVDWKSLTPDGKQQYDDAKRFAELATEAIKNRDYTLGDTLADKALTVAEGLLRR